MRRPFPSIRFAAYLNFDMVGRMQDNKLAVQATGTSPVWAGVLERANVAAGFDLTLQEDPYQPTDVATFNQAGVPSLNFTTGAHVDYHKPSDTADKINYEDLDRIATLASAVVRRLMEMDEAPQFAKVEQSSQTGRQNRRARVHRHRAGLHVEREGAAARRRDRRRACGKGGACRRAT